MEPLPEKPEDTDADANIVNDHPFEVNDQASGGAEDQRDPGSENGAKRTSPEVPRKKVNIVTNVPSQPNTTKRDSVSGSVPGVSKRPSQVPPVVQV